MTWLRGIDFRATAALVTDPSGYSPGYTYENTWNDYTSARGYGWETITSGGQDASPATANGDVRLAGHNYTGDPAQGTFRIDLPSAGQYEIQMAAGSWNGQTLTERVELIDNATSLAVIVNGLTAPAGSSDFSGWDANGTAYADSINSPSTGAAAWTAANPIGGGGTGARTFTFASTILRLKIGSGSGSSYTAILHLMVRQAGSTPLALTARAGGFGAARPAGSYAAIGAILIAAQGTVAPGMGAGAALFGRGTGFGGPRSAVLSTGTHLALHALGTVRSIAAGAARFAVPLSARGGGLGAGRGGIPGIAALVARGAVGISGAAGARFAAPLAGRTQSRARAAAPPSARSALAATARSGAFARAGAAFRTALEAQVKMQAPAAPGSSFIAGLQTHGRIGAAAAGTLAALAGFAATARALAIGTGRAAVTILTPQPAPPPMIINPTLEIVSENDGPQKG